MSIVKWCKPYYYLWKVGVILLLFLAALGCILVYITTGTAEKYSQETKQKLNASVAKDILSEVSPFIDGNLSEEAIDKIIHYMMVINPSIEVYILDADGKILRYVDPEKHVKLDRVNVEPIKTFIASGGQQYVTGDDPRNPNAKKVFSAAPVMDGTELRGYVYVVLMSEEHDSVASKIWGSYILRISGKTLLITLLGTLLIGLFVVWYSTKDLNRMIGTVREFKQGNLASRVQVKGEGGINDLAVAFNEMADTIVGNLDNLKSMESVRRELVGNISHDLRTPLAVIHGYLETLIIKKDDLNDEEKEKYLMTVLESTDSLRKLVDDLFELSKLEAKQVSPVKEPFPINELVQDICQKYHLMAVQREITVRAETEKKGYLVFADVSMIERVLQNLIDNALKFSPKGGKITVSAHMESENVLVCVTDTGLGIPTSEIPFIFDRYHIGDRAMAASSGNTGLGLSIVKKILEIHGEEIQLRSEVGNGASFYFRLKRFKGKST